MPEQFTLISHENHLTSRFNQTFFKQIPVKPGIYQMWGQSRDLLYIGKAKNLRRRLCAYRTPGILQNSRKTRRLLFRVRDITWEVLPSEEDAFTRESELIRELQPPSNIVGIPKVKKPLYLTAQATTEGLQFQLALTLSENSTLLGCFNGFGYFPKVLASLLRVLWCQWHPDVTGPSLLLRYRTPWKFKLPWPDTNREAEILALQEFFSGRHFLPVPHLPPHTLQFFSQILAQDLERLAEFYLKQLLQI